MLADQSPHMRPASRMRGLYAPLCLCVWRHDENAATTTAQHAAGLRCTPCEQQACACACPGGPLQGIPATSPAINLAQSVKIRHMHLSPAHDIQPLGATNLQHCSTTHGTAAGTPRRRRHAQGASATPSRPRRHATPLSTHTLAQPKHTHGRVQANCYSYIRPSNAPRPPRCTHKVLRAPRNQCSTTPRRQPRRS